ncbi:SLBB domain-containing protein [Bacteroides sp. ET489]|uniref:SLBB domain-containing protein n=1 Tax=Bacteroides sp. ET489 TaxID=3057126 RepID=UPI0026725D06|nr:SLBB domain-containing protein [Bacteroides sp. ET489]MDO3388889.1 SLBB domain-containing protein [Bacteroides sp. ET489]
MKMKRLLIVLLLVTTCATPKVYAQTRMTDQQVIEYVKQATQEGKEQKQIALELARKGVTRKQAERIKKQYEQQMGTDASNMQGTELNEARLREETQDETTALTGNQPTTKELAQEDQVFGRNIFNTRNLTFEPNSNMATPPNYQLGPGDEVIIDIWGASQTSIRQTITPDGTINMQELGPIYLSGMTVEEANRFLKNKLGTVFSNENNQIQVTLGNTRTIQINIMGEVVQPGTYALSAFSTVFHALYRAGGVNDIGSLRNVQLVRNGKKIAAVDVYDFIMQGKIKDDVRLQEGDVIIVPAYDMLVKMSGNVKRPMRFEMKKDETLAALIKYAGGFNADAYSKSVRMVRQNGMEYEVKTVDEMDYSVCQLRDGDVVTVGAILNRFTNKVEIKGAVYRPDIYALDGKVNTVRALIEKAQGLMDDAFTNRAVLQRQRDDLTSEIVSVDVRALMNGTIPDIPLRKNDILYIPSIHDLQDLGSVTIYGEVTKPDEYPYADNMTLEDLIIQAGGLKEAASTVRVDVSRRIKDTKSVNSTDSIGQMFSFALKDGFVIDGQPGFVLQPYDQVFVRRSPGYQTQQNVSIQGEVIFGGTYTLTSKAERLSDLVKKAGGVTNSAYVRGAKLIRVANDEEKKRMQDVVKLMGRELGENAIDSLGLQVDSLFSVGIDLEAALANPGGDADLVLREGDVLNIPEYVNTVKINGAVMMPNTVSYRKGEKVSYYLSQAGGYSQHAKKSKKFIIYMNGQVAKVKGNGSKQIEPGCEIIVPNKKQSKANIGNILGYATSFSSLATMAATIVTLFK